MSPDKLPKGGNHTSRKRSHDDLEASEELGSTAKHLKFSPPRSGENPGDLEETEISVFDQLLPASQPFHIRSTSNPSVQEESQGSMTGAMESLHVANTPESAVPVENFLTAFPDSGSLSEDSETLRGNVTGAAPPSQPSHQLFRDQICTIVQCESLRATFLGGLVAEIFDIQGRFQLPRHALSCHFRFQTELALPMKMYRKILLTFGIKYQHLTNAEGGILSTARSLLVDRFRNRRGRLLPAVAPICRILELFMLPDGGVGK